MTEWAALPFATDYTALAAATAAIVGSFGTSEPGTIIRSRGALSVVTDQVAQSERAFGAWGICLVTNQAFAIGISAIPTPVTDPESDLWFAYGEWFCPVATGTGSPVEVNNVSQTFEIDSKAMRKLTADQTAAVVIENASSSHGCFRSLNLRMLFKLS